MPAPGWYRLVLSILLVICALPAVSQPVEAKSGNQLPVRIDCDFAGGNIRLETIQPGVVRLRQDRRDTEGWWFYWYFRVRGAEGRELAFEFTDGEPIGVRGPAVSLDAGKSWRWLGAQTGNKRSFTYRFAADASEVRFAFAIPYLQSDWESFIRAQGTNELLRPAILCRSRKNRPVECLYVGAPHREPRHRILVTARHHACEAMAGYALEGLLETVIRGDTEEGRWLAEQTQILAVPFLDKDGVEDGDQGKNRRPRDHNRDYGGESIYPETAALRRLAPQWSQGKLHVALDLHCPWIRGPRNEVIYIVGSSAPSIWREQQALGAWLEQVARGPLPYRAADNLAYGLEWNKGENYAQGKSCTRWASELPEMRLPVSFELPYANARGIEVTPASARAFGKDLARALAKYLQKSRNDQ